MKGWVGKKIRQEFFRVTSVEEREIEDASFLHVCQIFSNILVHIYLVKRYLKALWYMRSGARTSKYIQKFFSGGAGGNVSNQILIRGVLKPCDPVKLPSRSTTTTTPLSMRDKELNCFRLIVLDGLPGAGTVSQGAGFPHPPDVVVVVVDPPQPVVCVWHGAGAGAGAGM